MADLVWKDTLLPGASRVALPWTLNGPVLPGYVGDSFNRDPVQGFQQRNDWVLGPGGRPVISGSSEQQGGPMVASPGFQPVDPGVYGGQVFAGRGGASSNVLQAVQSILSQWAGRPSLAAAAQDPYALEGFGEAGESPELAALIRALLRRGWRSGSVPV